MVSRNVILISILIFTYYKILALFVRFENEQELWGLNPPGSGTGTGNVSLMCSEDYLFTGSLLATNMFIAIETLACLFLN